MGGWNIEEVSGNLLEEERSRLQGRERNRGCMGGSASASPAKWEAAS